MTVSVDWASRLRELLREIEALRPGTTLSKEEQAAAADESFEDLVARIQEVRAQRWLEGRGQ